MHFQPIQRTQTLKFSEGQHVPEPYKTVWSRSHLRPPHGCYLVLARSRLSGFSPLHRFFPQFHIIGIDIDKMVKKRQFLFISVSNIFSRYEFCIVFGSFKVLKLRVFSFLRTFLFEFSCKRIRHLYMEEVHKHSMRTGKQRLRKRLVYKKQSSWGTGVREILVSIWGCMKIWLLLEGGSDILSWFHTKILRPTPSDK